MKHVKMLGLAAVAALALMAVVGAGSASAVTLCKEANKTCPEAQQYTGSTTITASLKAKTNATLTSSLGNVVCSKSSVGGKTSETSGSPLHGTITTLSFEGCVLGSTSCKVTTENLPYAASVTASSTAGNGVMTSPGRAHVECGSLMNCIFETSGATLTVTGGNPATVSASESLSRIENAGFICPSTSVWDAEYEVTAPKPLFISANP